MTDIVRDFHALTSLADGASASDRLLDFPVQDAANSPAPFKRYLGVDHVELPTDLAPLDVSATELMSGHHADPPRSFGARELAALLFYSAGVTRTSVDPDGTVRYFRAAPAGGNLHAHEVYVATTGLAPITPGLYHLRPDLHGLERLRDEDPRAALSRVVVDDEIASAPVSLVITGVPWRKGWRYRERGFRHIIRDIGSVLANLLYVADAFGTSYRVIAAFDDAGVAELLGVRLEEEPPIVVVRLGEGTPASGRDRLHALSLAAEPLSSEPHEFPLITGVRAAGDLDVSGVTAYRSRAAVTGTRVEARIPLVSRALSMADVILARGSTRVMRPETVDGELLQWSMAVATMPTHSDMAARGSTLLEHGVSIHGITGMSPGRYEWADGALDERFVLSEADARAASQWLCANQALGGDSAFTTYLSFDWDATIDEPGPRGYRGVLLESGIVLGRLNLAACALGYGASGLTTFDADVPAAFGATWTNIAACSVGVPNYRSRKGGLPGNATTIEGPARTRQLMEARRGRR